MCFYRLWLILKHFGAMMGAASARQELSYVNVTIALEKSHTNLRTGIRYDEHFLMPQRMKANFMVIEGITLI